MNYEKKINKLIPSAKKIADSQVGKVRKEDEKSEIYSARWNKVFHDAMDQLAASMGLRGTRKYSKINP
jgi:hypothetical protein